MARLPIIIAPDSRLKSRAIPVQSVDDDICTLMDDLLETMYAAHGIGLAAPQVGILKRVIVVDVAHTSDAPEPIAMANPEVIWESKTFVNSNEGCLSLPDYFSEVDRPETVKIRYVNRENEISEVDLQGILSTCVQHEIDHLDGILFVDHISSLRRNIILKKLIKAKRQGTLNVA